MVVAAVDHCMTVSWGNMLSLIMCPLHLTTSTEQQKMHASAEKSTFGD